ncbi:hypothetical protein PR202_ga14227 [Eleusine coracana subsp. coracana]|uniref:Uncharacterized protein n=1 Tax=Eleusine coracana subsp. coracana TaxID=191504 RepID=A0AAV5CG86_ELECO|nr:hypothetical protein PR202_ga14227 [Eleusine coracana subsp. coracana]
MSALPLPQGIQAQLDSRRRGFLWTSTDKVSGAQCLVAWERVWQPKEAGGIGIKQLGTQNQCLLLKLLHRLHHPDGSSWTLWARQNVCLATLAGDVQGTHWAALRALLPTYRQITSVSVATTGQHTSGKTTGLMAPHYLKPSQPFIATPPAPTSRCVTQ